MDVNPVINIAPVCSVFEDHSYAISPHFIAEGVKKDHSYAISPHFIAEGVKKDHSYAISPHFIVEGVEKSVMKVDVSWRNFIDQVFDVRLNDEISQSSRRITTPVGHIMPIGLIPVAEPELAIDIASENSVRHQSVSRRSL